MTDLDGVYYGQGLPPLADGDFGLTAGTVAAVISDIYDEQVGYGELHPGMYAETKRIFDEAVDTGVEGAVAGGADMPSDGFMGRLHDNAGVFAAFRTHAMQRDMVRLLTDNAGRLKSFAAFRRDAAQYASHRNRAWLKTEYDTAVNRAHFAARWRQFEEEKDVLPNLEWLPSTSPNPGADHRVFWGTVRPVDDAFWNEHRPGDRWNCKCELAATDKPETETPYGGDPKNNPAKGLKTNPGKRGEIFDKEHPYYPASCGSCPFAKNRLLALVSDLAGRQNCESCKALRKATAEAEQEPKVVKEFNNGGKFSIYSTVEKDKSDYKDLVTIGRFFAEKGNNVVLTPRVHIKSPMYEKIYGDLIGTRYERKCPDLKINGKFYEYESFEKPWKKQKVGRMLNHGVKQSDCIIINNNKGCTDRYIVNQIIRRLNDKSFQGKINEVWLYEKGDVRQVWPQKKR